MEEVVTVEAVAPHIVMVTIRRLRARNAINGAVAMALDRAVKTIEGDSDIWAAVLTGEGDQVFCAGADLKEIAAGRLPSLLTPDGGFAGFVYHPRDKLWIAAIEGLAVAGGFEIALACDLRVATEESAFALPEVTRGLAAAAGGIFRLPRELPRVLALELIATGERLPAARAAELGLLNCLVPKGQARTAAITLAQQICANAPLAVRESLKIARRALDLDDQDLRKLADEAQDFLATTLDFAEGPHAFIERRPPRWQGR